VKEERNTEWGEGQEKERLLQQSFFSAIWRAQRKIGDEYGRYSSYSLSLISPECFCLLLHPFIVVSLHCKTNSHCIPFSMLLLYALLCTVFLTNTPFPPSPLWFCYSRFPSLHPSAPLSFVIYHLIKSPLSLPSSHLSPLSLNTHNHPSLWSLLLWDTFSSFFQLTPDSPSPSPFNMSLFLLLCEWSFIDNMCNSFSTADRLLC